MGLVVALVCTGAVGVAQPAAQGVPDPRVVSQGVDPACLSRTLVATGGAAPKSPRTLAVRWVGHSNFELAYNGQVILLDAYYDRSPRFAPLGFRAADVQRADVILLGHGHVDHMSDAVSVARRTGALVVGAPVTTKSLQRQALDPKQIRTVTGRTSEVLEFKGFTVEPILGRHGEPEPSVVTSFNRAMSETLPPLTPLQQEEVAAMRARGTQDARVVAEGAIAYLITFDNGFRIMYRDTGGRVTDLEKAAMARIGGRVDVAIAASASAWLPNLQAERAVEFLRAYSPDVYFPAHHDDDIWRPTESIFQALKEVNPRLVTISKVYREPTCFDTDRNVSRR